MGRIGMVMVWAGRGHRDREQAGGTNERRQH